MQIGAKASLAISLGVIAGLGPITSADAASAICRKLESQLARAGSGSNVTRVDRTLIRQRQELNKAQRQLRAANCNFFNGSSQCSSIRAVISKMERNMVTLGNQAQGGGGNRARILAAIDANGCRNAPQRDMIARGRNRESQGVLSSFFGETRSVVTQQPDARRPWLVRQPRSTPSIIEPRQTEFRNRDANERRRDADEARRSVGTLFGAGTYQTICVRKSDGYYFPMSPSSYRRDFARDQNNCQAMCPEAEMSVYYKRLDDDETDAMVSIDSGLPYKALKTAYAYRQNPLVVGCGGDRRAAMLASRPAATVDFEFPVPSPKPDSDNTIPLWLGSPDAAIETPAPEERTVRVVGPTFLPDQSTEAGLPVQAPTLSQ